MFPDYMNFYEIGWLVFWAGFILYAFFIHNGRWKITVRVIVVGACLLTIFFGYQMVDVQGDESIKQELVSEYPLQSEILKRQESFLSKGTAKVLSRSSICADIYDNMLPSERKTYDVGRCYTDENYDPAIHKKELVYENKYEGNFELYEKAMRKMELDKLIELKMLRDANAQNKQKKNIDSEVAMLRQEIETLKAMQNQQYYIESPGTNNYAQCLIDTGSFAGCDSNYQRPIEVDVNVSGEIDLDVRVN